MGWSAVRTVRPWPLSFERSTLLLLGLGAVVLKIKRRENSFEFKS